ASLDEVVLRALAKDPARRFRDADEFIAALQREREALPAPTGARLVAGAALGAPAWAGGGAGASPPFRGARAGGDGAGAHPLLLPAAAGRPGQPAPARGRNRRRRRILAVLAAALIGAGVALALLLGGGSGHVRVPEVTGQNEAVATAELRRAGLVPVVSQAASADVARGLVISQVPSHGARVARGSHVSLSVSSGPGSAALPDVEGLAAARARARLKGAGFRPAAKSQPSASVASGLVVGTDPPAGTELQLGSA